MKIHNSPVVSTEEVKALSDTSVLAENDIEIASNSDQYCTSGQDHNRFISVPFDKRIAQGKTSPLQDEEQFIESPTLSAYGKLAEKFVNDYKMPYNEKYYDLEHILITPSADEEALLPEYTFDKKRDIDMESWNQEAQIGFAKDVVANELHAIDRHRKIKEKGLGIGGSLSKPIYHGKEVGHFTKNNLMVKGYIYKACDATCGKTIFELLPNFKSRKVKIVSIRLTEMAVELVLEVAGIIFAPVTLGASKLISNQLNNVVTLSGEAMLSKVKGAKPEKIAMQSTLRGVQLEVPAGEILNIAERGASAMSTLSILSSFLADVVLRHVSTRYTGLIHPSQLGNSDVLYEMNQRIDYLAQFLIPYGKLMMTRAKTDQTKKKLRFIMAEQFRILRKLEQSKTKALHFYHVSLLDERLPADHREKIESDIEFACPDTRKNSHRLASRCSYALMQQAGEVLQEAEVVGDIEMQVLSR